MPQTLHWFKWQNGITWLSGISLLVVVYYMGGAAMHGRPRRSPTSRRRPRCSLSASARCRSAWIVYDVAVAHALGKQTRRSRRCCRSRSSSPPRRSTSRCFSGRAAYIHVGVLIGTLMTGNVWFVIMPSQRELIAATKEGREQDPAIGYQAKQRSIHNNYLTFPLLFIMISDHFPSTYGHPQLAGPDWCSRCGSAGIRHFMNIRFTEPRWLWPAVGAVRRHRGGRAGDDGATASILGRAAQPARTTPVAFGEVADIIAQPLHRLPLGDADRRRSTRSRPTASCSTPPSRSSRRPRESRSAPSTLKNMPLANITEHDRRRARPRCGAWIDQGAKGPQ